MLLCVQETVAGVIVLACKEALQHHGIALSMEGVVNLQLSSKSVGVFEAFYNSVKVRSSPSSPTERWIKEARQHKYQKKQECK